MAAAKLGGGFWAYMEAVACDLGIDLGSEGGQVGDDVLMQVVKSAMPLWASAALGFPPGALMGLEFFAPKLITGLEVRRLRARWHAPGVSCSARDRRGARAACLLPAAARCVAVAVQCAARIVHTLFCACRVLFHMPAWWLVGSAAVATATRRAATMHTLPICPSRRPLWRTAARTTCCSRR